MRLQNIAQRITGTKPELMRMPVDELRGLHAGFTPLLAEHAKGLMKTHMLTQWANFTKQAAEQGYSAIDGAQVEPQVLDGLSPTGVLAIDMTVGDNGTLSVQRVELPGVSTSVLDEIRTQQGGLATIGVHRRVQVSEHRSDAGYGKQGVGGYFELDRTNKLIGHLDELSTDAKMMFANFAHGATKQLDVDALTGMAMITAQLEKIPRSTVH